MGQDDKKLDPKKVFTPSQASMVKGWLEADETGRCQERFLSVFQGKEAFLPEDVKTTRTDSASKKKKQADTGGVFKFPTDPVEQDNLLRELYTTTSHQAAFGKQTTVAPKGINHVRVGKSYINNIGIQGPQKQKLNEFFSTSEDPEKDGMLDIMRRLQSFKNARTPTISTYKDDYIEKEFPMVEKNGPDAFSSGIVKVSDFAKPKEKKKKFIPKTQVPQVQKGEKATREIMTFKSQFTTSEGHTGAKTSSYQDYYGDANLLQKMPAGFQAHNFNVSASVSKCVPEYHMDYHYVIPNQIPDDDHVPENFTKTTYTGDFKAKRGAVKKTKPQIDPYKSQIDLGLVSHDKMSTYQSSFVPEEPPRNQANPRLVHAKHYWKR
eukprot:GFYU01005693.1.p1 GENE.GFYU01005693.1~~GFYU01005693.1.p1  ORF type:complete len:378 (+),score=150.11 GFYU01005693.1:160-1293(+)